MVLAGNRLYHIASQHVEDLIEIKDEIFKLIAKLEMRHDDRWKQPSMSKVVGDPTIVKTKGVPCKKKYGQKRRQCSNCKKSGHNVRRCPEVLSQGDSTTVDEETSSSDSEIKETEFDESMVLCKFSNTCIILTLVCCVMKLFMFFFSLL